MKSYAFLEPAEHGTPDFPCEYHYVDSSHPRYSMPFHWHKEWEMIHVIEGSFDVHADERMYSAKRGDMLLIQDSMLHGGIPKNCIYECLLFDLHGFYRNFDILKKYLRPIYRRQILPEIYYPAGKNPEIDHAVSLLTDACRNTPAEETVQNPLELIVFGGISQLFAAILQQHLYTLNQGISPDTAHKIDLLKNVLEYIELHYSQTITLNDLAHTAGMNPKYFCRYFRSIIHQTPIEYVNMYRIEKASRMLLDTDLSVTTIGIECGFNDTSHFIRVFRKYKGMTPGQYQRA